LRQVRIDRQPSRSSSSPALPIALRSRGIDGAQIIGKPFQPRRTRRQGNAGTERERTAPLRL